MSKTHLILIVFVGLGLLFLGAYWVNDLRDDLKKAESKVNELTNTVNEQAEFLKEQNKVSNEAIKSKQELANDETQTKQQVRTIVQTVDCSRALVPQSAADGLRQYADRIRNPTPTH